MSEPSKPFRRFARLEIGELTASPPTPSSVPPIAISDQRMKPAAGTLCSHCGQANEEVRDYCWACLKTLKAVQPPTSNTEDVVTIVLNGVTYNSSDPGLPQDVQTLMRWIQKYGYSEKLLKQWQDWRQTRSVPKVSQAGSRRVSAFRGDRVTVLRLDDKVYLSDQPDLPPDIQALMERIQRDGVTPELLQDLRQRGPVQFRPENTPLPSDGDVHFWNHVSKIRKAPPNGDGSMDLGI